MHHGPLSTTTVTLVGRLKRAEGLPPGQRLLAGDMPRFTDRPYEHPPTMGPLLVEFSRNRTTFATLDAAGFEALGPRKIVADFHCVTTWSMKGLTWTGVPLIEVMNSLDVDHSDGEYVVVRAGDHRRGHFLLEDLIRPEVLLATHLDGTPLGPRHGGPIRLVAPDQYGYKSIKHVVRIDIRAEKPKQLGLEHLRGRVAFEERHPKYPNWLIRRPFRMLIPAAAALAERNLGNDR